MSLFSRFRPQFVCNNLLIRANLRSIFPCRMLSEESFNQELHRKRLAKRRQTSELTHIKEFIKFFKHDVKWWARDLKERYLQAYSADNQRFYFEDGELIKFWDFNQTNTKQISSYPLEYKKDKCNDMNNFYYTCDSEYDLGYSKCSWTVSPSGYGLFSGYLDNTLPKDGKQIRTGYAYLGSYKARKPFNAFGNTLELETMTHIVLRVRGDGRRYFIIFDNSDIFDFTWHDKHQYMLYTHGGPYWQYVKIPLTRFFFQFQGYIQDQQYILQPFTIRNVGILVHDIFSGPFRLEIDYIGFMHDSQHHDTIEYESYFHETSPFAASGLNG